MKKQILTYVLLFFLSTKISAQGDQTATPQWRPVYHFTPEKNWTNDPNGLIFINGNYHMFNQQNPFENKWGHMSWGHAISTDLIHWKHLPIAIPEVINKDTTWIFSGSAVLDENNSSGFCKNKNCLIAIYTADQPNLKKESQFIAYSNDDGMTFTNYEKNPVIDLNKKDFRDPNVSWNTELKKWVMVAALPTEHKVRFYASDNLKEWIELSEFGDAGYANAAWECPSLIQLPVEGSAQKNKWILMVSAAGGAKGVFMQYFVGDFSGGVFKNDNPPNTILTVDYGDCLYAAIPWNNQPENKKILIGWMTPGARKTNPWTGQMSIARDLSLREDNEGMHLVQQPSSVVKNNLAKLSNNALIEMRDLKIDNKEILIDKKQLISGNAYWIEAEFAIGPGTTSGFKIAQKKSSDNKIKAETEIGYDASKHQLYVDRSNTGDDKIKREDLRRTIDIKNELKKIKLEILFDKSSLEVFFNNGEKVLTTHVFADKDANALSVFSKDGSTVITSLKVWDLSRVK